MGKTLGLGLGLPLRRSVGLGLEIMYGGGEVDSEAPAAPTGLTATAGESSITLTWTDPADLDLASIRVYRSTTSGSGFSLIATVAAGVEEYEDETASTGVTYYYRLTAIDAVPNESDPTAEDSAEIAEGGLLTVDTTLITGDNTALTVDRIAA